MPNDLTRKAYDDFLKSVELFKKSLDIYKPLDPHEPLSDAQMQYYDALSFRYQKLIETAIYYFRTLELYLFQMESPTLRDQLLKMEKLGLVSSTEQWMEARALRNKITHAYAPEDLAIIYHQAVTFGKMVINDSLSIVRHLKTL